MPLSDAEKLETMIVDYLLNEKRCAAGMSLDDVAIAAYPEDYLTRARMKLYRLRKPKKDGSPKRLYIDDFVHICKALDLDPVRQLTLCLEKFESKKS